MKKISSDVRLALRTSFEVRLKEGNCYFTFKEYLNSDRAIAQAEAVVAVLKKKWNVKP